MTWPGWHQQQRSGRIEIKENISMKNITPLMA